MISTFYLLIPSIFTFMYLWKISGKKVCYKKVNDSTIII